MIDFRFSIQNIWNKNPTFKGIKFKHWSLTKHKTLEMELCRYTGELFDLELNTCFRGHDHAGFKMAVSVACYNLSISLVDNRHWCYSTNTWEKQENTK